MRISFLRRIAAQPLTALLFAASLLAASAALPGCGGGGGGGGGNATTVVRGIVFDSANQDTEVEGATVQIGGQTTTTYTRDQANVSDTDDIRVGEFVIENAEVGANTAVVTVPGGSPQTLAFTPPVGNGSNPFLELFINIGQVRGRVLSPSGQPQEGATVTIINGGFQATTASDGTFLIENIPTGPTDITAVFGPSSKQLTGVNIGSGITEVGDIQLIEDQNPNPPGSPYTITGTVTSSDNSNGAGASVVLTRNGTQIEQTSTVDTNGDGTYEYYFYVPAGEYGVRVIRPGYQDATGTVTVSNPNSPQTLNLVLNPI